MEVNSQEHLQWAKQRALESLEYYRNSAIAFTSLSSDLRKHSQLRNHPGISIGTQMLALGKLTSVAAMRKFLEDFS
ncbi:hypothetical protein BV372_08075 [Nostoc sp. T09]|uniref:hypothetical protein n=1 Tax=Nostoc sp. T09 TaxID=1932621 RepID=UPI000A371E7A|nr:hypothetical protein [Nostoc sp. T09]OUL36365.1 hypothetical protein BV372_08075 [Nostoc sp. T09]